MTRAFLSAAWRHLAMLNYRVEPRLLAPYVPPGTMLDLWDGAPFMSVIAFLFDDTKILGVPIPFHTTFPEVNLRIYTRREAGDETRRGVTFIRELAPRHAVAWTARFAYNEPYRALPMRRRIAMAADPGGSTSVDYEWSAGGAWSGVHMTARGRPIPIQSGSHEDFIAHRRWGFTRQRDGSSIEYQVEHARWNAWQPLTFRLDGDPSRVFPADLARELTRPPDSAFLVDGSGVTVSTPARI